MDLVDVQDQEAAGVTCECPLCAKLRDRVEELEAENVRLREMVKAIGGDRLGGTDA